jgi:hypothetical protein
MIRLTDQTYLHAHVVSRYAPTVAMRTGHLYRRIPEFHATGSESLARPLILESSTQKWPSKFEMAKYFLLL